MKYPIPSLSHRNRRAFIASVLSYILLAGQMTPLVLASNNSATRVAVPHAADAAQEKTIKAPTTGAAPVPVALSPMPVVVAPVITATKTDAFPSHPSGKANPGDTITYTVTINNTGPDPATNLTLTDTVDPNTTIVPGSAVATPIATDESYSVLGNVRIQPNAAGGLLANDNNPNTGNNTGLTASGPNTGPTNGQATINADGSFSYNPNPGFTGTDSFTYTVTSTNGTDTATVTLNIGNGTGTGGTNVPWFVNPSAPAGGDGRLTNPFNCYTGTSNGAQTCFSDTAADDPGDTIFLFSGAHTGGYTLLNNEKLVGQGATATLASLGGFTVPAHSDALPATGGASPTITTTIAATNAVTLGQGNVLRGFTVGNTTGAKIFGSGFGTVTVGNNASPDVILNGTGQALNLTTGTFAATSAFTSVATTSSGTQGIILTGVTGTVAFGSTTVSGATTQGILIGTTTADINFGNTSITGGTDGISFQNNSSGTRTIGTLTRTGGTGAGFLHGGGGGVVNVTGATSITNPAGNGIDVDGSNANLSFAATTVDKSTTSGTGVDLTNNATRTIGFTSLAVTTSNGVALNTNNSGTVNAGGGSLTATGTGGAASLTNTTLGLTFTSVSSDGGANGLIISGGSGTFTSGTTSLLNNAGIGLLMSSSAVAANFGNTTVNSSAGDGVDLSSNTAAITFADLDIAPDPNLRGLDASSNTGTITTTSGTISTTDAVAVNVASSPLSMTLTSVSADNTGTANSCVSLTTASGTLNMQGGTLTGGTSAAFFVSGGNPTVTYSGSITQNSAARVVDIQGTTANTITFNTGTVTGGASNTGVHIGDTSVANGNVSFANLNLGTSGARMTNQAVTITGGSGTKTLGAVSIFTTGASAQGIVATNSTGAISTASGEVNSAGAAAVNIVGVSAASRTPLNIQLTSVSANGGSNGIVLTNTNTTGSPGGFNVLGTTSGNCGGVANPGGVSGTLPVTADCTGGQIQSTTGATGGNTGIGILLDTVTGVSLTRMRINGHSNFGVKGTTVSTFTMVSSYLHNNGDDVGGEGEGCLYFFGLTGSASVTNSYLELGAARNISVINTSGVLNRLTVSGTTIGNDGTNGSDGIFLQADNSANTAVACTVKATVQNGRFLGSRGDGIQFSVRGTSGSDALPGSSSDLVFTGNRMRNNHPNKLPTNFAVAVSAGGTLGSFNPAITYNISNNNISEVGSTGISVGKGGNGSGRFVGTISGNSIGEAGVANSGSAQGSAIVVDIIGAGLHSSTITNNTIRQFTNFGILAQSGNNAAAQGGQGNLVVDIRGNNIAEPSPASATALFPTSGIRVVLGTNSGDNSNNCVTIGGVAVGDKNTVTGTGTNGGSEIRLFQRFVTILGVPGYAGANNDNNAMNAFLLARNVTAAPTAGPNATNNTATPGPGYSGTCTTPSAPVTFDTSAAIEAEGTQADAVTAGGIVTGDATGRTATGGAQGQSSMGGGVTSRPFVSFPAQSQPRAATPGLLNTTKRGGSNFRNSAKDSVLTLEGIEAVKTSTSAVAVVQGKTTPRTPVSTAGPTTSETPNPNPPVINGDTLTFTIGTLPAGASVTITFQVTVDNPYNGGLNVSNQGTITANGISNVLTDDPDVAGANNPTLTPIDSINIFARDAKVAEPATGTSQMLFTIALSAPATGAVSVNASTADGGATPATGGASCATAGVDYESITNVPVNFVAGEQLKTVPVTVCSDAVADDNETLLLNISGASGGTIQDAQAVGTITPNTPGTFIISELRTSGPGGLGDDFVELYNNTNSPLTVAASDASAGFGLYKMGTDCNAAPVLIATIPSGTVIPARGHYLVVGSQYSLANYGGTGAAAGNVTMTSDIESDRNVAVFTTADVTQLSSSSRLDAVGFDGNTGGGVCDLLREGTNLAPVSGSTTEHSFFRKECDFVAGVGCAASGNPKDTNDNSADFAFADTQGTFISGVVQRLGAPGPENLSSPIRRDTSGIGLLLLDGSQSSSAPPNRVRDFASNPGANSTFGTLALRRRVVNSTGAAVTRLRFRIIEMTTFPSPGGGTADLRARTSTSVSVSNVNDAGTCLASTGSATMPCTVTVQGTTFEQPPTQPNGGGINSSLAAGTVTLGTPLANGASVNVQFLLGVQTTGTFRFLIIIEALP
jgi:hypothetical protein